MSAIVTLAGRGVVVKSLYNPGEDRKSGSWRSDELEIRCGRQNQHPKRLVSQALGWAAQENEKETRLWPIEWGSICCGSVRSPTPSHSKTLSNPFEPFQIKWEVYFSKELSRSSLLCRRYDSACIQMYMYYVAIQHSLLVYIFLNLYHYLLKPIMYNTRSIFERSEMVWIQSFSSAIPLA